MKKLKYHKIKKVVGDLISIDNGELLEGLLRVRFGFVNGIVPLEIVIDKELNVIYTKQNYTTDQKINIGITKIRKHLYKVFTSRNSFVIGVLRKCVNMTHKPICISYYSIKNKDRFNAVLEELEER